jgi:ATP-dependent helicase/nuclease subunit B
VKVIAHPDPFVLERELLTSLATARDSDPLAPLLVLVPTRRLADHVQRRLGEERSAWINLEVLHFNGAALRILEAAGEEPPQLLSPRLQEAVLQTALQARELSNNRWSRFVELRPGALRALQSTITDLREAGIPPDALAEEAAGRRGEPGLAEIYSRYVHEMELLEQKKNLGDHTSRVGRAIIHAAAFGGRYRSIWLHGAYELLGAHLDLLRALDGQGRVTVLLPASPREEAPATAHARRFAETCLLHGEEILPAGSEGTGGLLGARLEALYDELASPAPLGEGKVAFRNFQGGMSEVEWAVRGALDAAAEGVPPSEIGIVARSLHTYAPLLEAAFRAADISWTSSVEVPLRREPVIHDLLVLLRILVEDFPRAATAELLGSPRIRWDRLLSGAAAPPGDLAEAWSRRAGILGGLDGWTETLVDWASEVSYPEESTDDERERIDRHAAWKRSRAGELARAVRRLESEYGDLRPSSWSAHADHVEKIVSNLLPGCGDEYSDEPALVRLFELLDDMRRLDAIGGHGGKIPLHKGLEWLEGAVDDSLLPIHGEENGGIRVLDAMQARGLTFKRLFLLGFHSGLFPRIPKEDPFLSDDFRRRLRQGTARPLPVKEEGEEEEHLLLSILLGSAAERIYISWQRADDSGRASSPSLALREVARVVLGRPDYNGLVNDLAARTAADPLLRLEETLLESGMLSASEELLLLALRGDGPESVAAGLAGRRPELTPGLRMLITTESFEPGAAEFDGRIGDAAPRPDPLSASALGKLGSCPLQFFFERILHLRPLEDEQTAFDLIPSEIGLAVHSILERIYRTLRDDRLLSGGNGEAAAERAVELLDPVWNEMTGAIGHRIGRRFETLWRAHESDWLQAIRRFLREDIPRISRLAPDVIDLEKPAEADVDLGEGVRISAVGRFDRLLRTGDELLVTDYKTSGKLKEKTNPTYMLKGLSLQVPLYAHLAGGAAVELLGVGPCYDPEDADRPADSRFDGLEGRQLEGLQETLRVLTALAERGLYPMNPPTPCRWCPYTAACRRNHAPTQERELHARDTADFRDLAAKNQRSLPLLDDVRADRNRKEEEGR